MGDKEKPDWTTEEMQKGWQQVDPALRDRSGAQISGKTLGKILESVTDGIPVEKGLDGTIDIFRLPKQTQFVILVKDGVERVEAYDPALHGPLQDIRLMDTTPSQLLDQLQQSDDKAEVPASQQFASVRKGGASRTRWLSDDHPKPKKKQ
ncbi:hypothetical protein HY949_04850 [Candidatus Gottesmanbacteria bacterium]|nr:hypothetical protein [Candidatus Gottesmanbacteria bacterium]